MLTTVMATSWRTLRVLAWLLSLLGLPAAAIVLAEEKTPRRIVIECEDMVGVAQDRFGPSETWQVGRWGHDLYQNMTFGGVFCSRLRTAMTDAGDNPSEIYSDFAVPEDGTYKIWVKYECPPFFNYAFGLRLERLEGDRQVVFEKIYGLRDSAKHFSFMKELVTGDLYWNWGIEHDAAEGYPVTLRAGKYRLVIAKVRNPEPAGWRSLDAVLITSDLSELSAPDYPLFPLLEELKKENHVYFRFRNPQGSEGPIRIYWNRCSHRRPYYYAPSPQERARVRFYEEGGRELSGGKDGTWQEPIPPGGASPWHDLGPVMCTATTTAFTVRGLRPGGKPSDPSKSIAVDIALSPREDAIVRSFELPPGAEALNFLVQPDIYRPEGQRYTKLESDIYAELITELEKEPRIGPMPQKLRLFSDFGSISQFEDAMRFRQAIGLNTVTTDFDAARQLEWAKDHGSLVKRSLVFHHSQDPEKIIEWVGKNGVQEYFYYLSYGDEIGLPPVKVDDPEVVAKFREFVQAAGETPESLGVKGWDDVKPIPAISPEVVVQIGVTPSAGEVQSTIDVSSAKKLFWYSTQFRKIQGIATFVEKTRRLQEALGPEVRTTANLGSMMPFYWMDQASFIEAFKEGAMTLAWSEDYTYCQPEASRLVVDFEVAFLRKGASYRDTPMQFYCMAHWPGNNPEQLLQNVVLAWGQNVKDIDYFSAIPDVWNTENYVAYRGGLPTFKAVRTISGMAGLIEDHLLPARTKGTPIAVLLSEASDLWETEGQGQGVIRPGSRASNVSQEERKNIWYCLRYAGYRVDFVTENDCLDGLLKNYSVLYVCGQNLHHKAAEVIRQWVADGGILVVTSGAARKDQFDGPLYTLDEVLGRGRATVASRYQGPLRARLELVFQEPLDQIECGGGKTMPVFCSREEFESAESAEVVARYSNGAPAVTKQRFGSGWAYYAGVLPGQTWAKAALPVSPQGKGGPHHMPWMREYLAHDPVAEDMILEPVRKAGLVPDVETDCRGVITNRLESHHSTVITVVNLALEEEGELKDVILRVHGLPQVGRVWSCFHQQPSLLKSFKDGTAVIHLPRLGSADVVVIEH